MPSIKVEEVLLRHGAVANAAAVGLSHQRWGEAVTAFVTLKPGAAVEPGELDAHCRAHLGGFEVPKDIVVLDLLPMTSTGKIQKFELRQRYRHTTRAAPPDAGGVDHHLAPPWRRLAGRGRVFDSPGKWRMRPIQPADTRHGGPAPLHCQRSPPPDPAPPDAATASRAGGRSQRRPVSAGAPAA